MNYVAKSDILEKLRTAFFSDQAPEIFYGIAHTQDVFRADPFDVETIHQEARLTFSQLTDRACLGSGLGSGRVMLLLGEAGTGKTHLMRAFRNHVHGQGLGYCGYMQMSTVVSNYCRYVLRNLINSMTQPYSDAPDAVSALTRLSTSLIETGELANVSIKIKNEQLTPQGAIQACSQNPAQLNKVLQLLTQKLMRKLQRPGLDPDIVSAVLALQTDDSFLKSLLLKFLRCEAFSESQRSILNFLNPRLDEEDPLVVLESLATLMWQANRNILVLCVDQLEGIFNLEDSTVMFRRMMDALVAIADRIPSSVIVISCLQDFYDIIAPKLSSPVRARLESNPEPIRLKASRSYQEIVALVSQRLQHLYDMQGIAVDLNDSNVVPYRCFPIVEADLQALNNRPTRDVLNFCNNFQRQRKDRADATMAIGDNELEKEQGGNQDEPENEIENLWNDYILESENGPPPEAAQRAQLLAQTLLLLRYEQSVFSKLAVRVVDKQIKIDGYGEPLLIGLCEKAAQGGALARELAHLEQVARGRKLVLARSTEFPRPTRSAVSTILGGIIAEGGMRVVIEDSDWRVMASYPSFQEKYQAKKGFKNWLVQRCPLSSLRSIRAILALDLPDRSKSSQIDIAKSNGAVLDLAISANRDKGKVSSIILGSRLDLPEELICMNPTELLSNILLLGSPGCGKTCAAANIIEQALGQRIPVIIIDRQGELCNFANTTCDDDSHKGSVTPSLKASRTNYRFQLYTPGAADGRQLGLDLLPGQMQQLSEPDRDNLARFSAEAICSMLGYNGHSTSQRSQQAILKCALKLLGEIESEEIRLEQIISLLSNHDRRLVSALGHLDTKYIGRLLSDLETLKVTRKQLFLRCDDKIDFQQMLGSVSESNDVPSLSVICTKFVGNEEEVQFWLARFFLSLQRWVSSNPSNKTQGLIVLDDADVFLPASGKPPTKEPLEQLLRRARSAGLGMLLMANSPGDLDYRSRECFRTWLIGRIKEETAIKKLRPVFGQVNQALLHELAAVAPGQFCLLREGHAVTMKSGKPSHLPRVLKDEEIVKIARQS